MTYSLQALQKEWVQEKGIKPSDFLVLATQVLKKSRAEFFKQADFLLTQEEYQLLVNLLARRLQSEPVAYLVGHKEFFGRDFTVDKSTLIPRPDSECLIENVLSFAKNNKKPDVILDIGTGSGALIVTLASELADTAIKYMASDTSSDALVVAEKNKVLHNVPVTLLEGSLLEPYQHSLKTKAAVYIIANLPYLSEAILTNTKKDVKDYEPHTALVSEDEGLAHYQKLFQEMRSFPNLTGVCWIEISPEQKAKALVYISQHFPNTNVLVGQDLSQRDRFIRFTF